MEKILTELEKFGFSKIEAIVYLTLLKNPKINGSQLAKKISLSRASVYSGIEILYKKGAINLVPQSSNTYIAKDPIEFIKKLKEEYLESANFLEKEFESFENFEEEGDFYNLKGYKNTIDQIKKMISSAQKEIYINTNCSLENFKVEFKKAKERDVRIILFTFEKQDFEKYEIEAYYNSKFIECAENSFNTERIMIVVDNNIAFIGSGKKNGDFLGSFSSNKLFVQIISEHIHHDIYLLEIEKIYGTEWYKEIKLKTIHELGN